MRFNSLLSLAIVATLALSGCGTETASDGPLIYQRHYEGNVSTFFGPLGPARSTLQDTHAPDFYWKNSKGAVDSLSGHKGQVVLLNFWATWCGPCKMEMPDLQALSDEMGDTVSVIGISVDYPGDAFTLARNYVSTQNFHYQIILDSAYTLFERYLLETTSPIPQSFVINTHGQTEFQFTGAQIKDTLKNYVRKAYR